MPTKHSRPIRTIRRASIGLASGVIAFAAVGVAGASAATINHATVNATQVSHTVIHTGTSTSVAAVAGAFGGHGSHGAAVCKRFDSAIKNADAGYTKAAGKGDIDAAANAADREVALLQGAESAGCGVVWPV